MDEMARAEYLRAKGTSLSAQAGAFLNVQLTDTMAAFVTANPPESLQTEISLSQYLAIQEKGVSAWEFEPELEIANCFVEGRTEIEFFDTECTVLTNLPVPKQNDVYYWEAKIYDKPDHTQLSIGMATKPYPLFRLPGINPWFRVLGFVLTMQASTNTRWRTSPPATVAITSPSARTATALLSSKATWLA